jgi:hypothetical protein
MRLAPLEKHTCCLASHMQEVKSIYFCSVNPIVLELLALDYRLADAVLTQNGFVLCDSYEKMNWTSKDLRDFRPC